jgi:transposase InsO family protein
MNTYLNNFKKNCDEKGIARQLTIPYTPQQNGESERRNKILFDIVRSMMTHANLQISFWGDTLLTATYILICVSSKSISSIPYKLWNNDKSNIGYLQ